MHKARHVGRRKIDLPIYTTTLGKWQDIGSDDLILRLKIDFEARCYARMNCSSGNITLLNEAMPMKPITKDILFTLCVKFMLLTTLWLVCFKGAEKNTVDTQQWLYGTTQEPSSSP
ncbi:MAG: hypothetical protein NXI01_02570 [Gammaproteobacteria bacterium]|nr:hypothetical protein [Gammaproteobacteria bacterium]